MPPTLGRKDWCGTLIRRLLGVGPHDQIAFIIEDGQVRLERKRSVIERTYGVLKSNRPPLSAEELRAAAEQAIADEVVEGMGS